MKNKDLVTLFMGINNVMSLNGVVFGYALNKNLAILKPEIEALQKALAGSKEFEEYNQKRIEIVKKYALKDDKGDFILIGQGNEKSYDVGANGDVVESEVAPLKEEYKDAIAGYQKQIDEYNALLEKEADIKLYKVKMEDVPKEITGKQLEGIFEIIEE